MIYTWGFRSSQRNKDGRVLEITADEIVNRIAAENHLPPEDSKHEKLVLKNKRRRKNAEVKWVKWLGIITDESLTFQGNWKARIKKAWALLTQFDEIGTHSRGPAP